MEDKTVNIETATAPDKKLLLRAAAWGFAAVIVRWAILAVGLFWHSTAMTNLCRILSVISGVGFGVAFVVFIVRRGRKQRKTARTKNYYSTREQKEIRYRA